MLSSSRWCKNRTWMQFRLSLNIFPIRTESIQVSFQAYSIYPLSLMSWITLYPPDIRKKGVCLPVSALLCQRSSLLPDIDIRFCLLPELIRLLLAFQKHSGERQVLKDIFHWTEGHFQGISPFIRDTFLSQASSFPLDFPLRGHLIWWLTNDICFFCLVA